MKQLFAISFIVALIIPFSGTFLWLKHQKKMVRKEVKQMMIEGVDKEDLVTFSFTETQVNTELNWKHSKEFEYQGKMYDIVSFYVEGDRFVYSCWLDKEETKLNKQLATLFGKKWNAEKGKYHDVNNLDHFVDSLFVEFTEVSYGRNPYKIKFIASLDDALLDVDLNCFSPPPEL